MRFFSYALLAALVVTVLAAPPPAKKQKLTHSSPAGPSTELPKSELSSKDLVTRLVNIDATCTKNAEHGAKLQRALEDMYTLAMKAQAVKEKDVAFTNYFIPGNHLKPFDKAKLTKLPMDPYHIRDSVMVPNMFKSIVTGGGKNTKFVAFCPTEEEQPECKHTLAFTTGIGNPEWIVAFCPLFFAPHELETTNDLSSHKFTTDESDHDRWCLPPKHTFGHLITAGHTALHEITHLSFIVQYAAEQSVGGIPAELAKKIEGTVDIKHADKNHPGNMKTYSGYAPAVARILAKRWVAYLAQSDKVTTLKQPPLAPIDNAEDYAALATEYYFWKMCSNFDPKQVIPVAEAD